MRKEIFFKCREEECEYKGLLSSFYPDDNEYDLVEKGHKICDKRMKHKRCPECGSRNITPLRRTERNEIEEI